MLGTIDRADLHHGRFRIAYANGTYGLLSLRSAAHLALGHVLRVPEPDVIPDEPDVLNTTTGETITIYLQDYGGSNVWQ